MGYNLKPVVVVVVVEILAQEGINVGGDSNSVDGTLWKRLPAAVFWLVNPPQLGVAVAQQLVASTIQQSKHSSDGNDLDVRVAAMQVINLRTLKPIDRDAIVKSVTKTHRVVVVEEGWPQSGVASGMIPSSL